MIGTELAPALNESTNRFLLELNRFSSQNFNSVPSTGGWTAGQVAEHILLSDISIHRVLEGGFEFAGRKVDEKVELIRQALINRENKLQAPSAAIPSDFLKDPLSLQEKITRERNSIVQFINSVEEDSLCSLREHRFFGKLTVTEWVWFLIYHTDRHIEQLKLIESEK